MSLAEWFLLIGGLMLVMGLHGGMLKRLPVTTAIIYLAVGFIVGPSVTHQFHFNPLKQSGLLEIFTELAVLLSLFSAGMKMAVPVSLARWRAPALLAFVSLTAVVGIMTAFGHFVLALPLGAAVLLGAILAPTDPVLATDVQVRHPGDTDRLRFTLTCEAGMNDGSAFPFVMLGLGLLGLHEIGDNGVQWFLQDVLWATAAGIGAGILFGIVVARVVWMVGVTSNHPVMGDFVGLGLIGLVYGFSLMINAWGFLAVFFAAVAFRQTELLLAQKAAKKVQCEETAANVSETAMMFNGHLERLSELILVLIVGGTLFVDSWSWRAVGAALFLFIVARPVSVLFSLCGTRKPVRMRAMVGWFGVRGIGSLYYLMYAIEHGLPEEIALDLIHIVLIVVTLSIVIHGLSVKPILRKFWRPDTTTPEQVSDPERA